MWLVLNVDSYSVLSPLAGRGLGQFGGRDDVVYWKCEEGQLLEEVLTVPMTNIRREEALITAAHQQMTEMEYERRRVTGTLNSSTITTKAVELLTVGGKLQNSQKQPRVSSVIIKMPYLFSILISVAVFFIIANVEILQWLFSIITLWEKFTRIYITLQASQINTYYCTQIDSIRGYL